MIDDRYIPFRSSCTGCKHFDMVNYVCPAFPLGIPTEVLTGSVKHNFVIKGQEGNTVREGIEVKK